MKKILMVMVLGLVGFSAFANEYANKQQELLETSKERMWTEVFTEKETDPNIEAYLEMKTEVQNLENELEQKDKVDLIGLRELEDLTAEVDEFFEREVLGWEEETPAVLNAELTQDVHPEVSNINPLQHRMDTVKVRNELVLIAVIICGIMVSAVIVERLTREM